jgi:hypothetical protein
MGIVQIGRRWRLRCSGLAVIDTGETDHVFHDANYFCEPNDIVDLFVVIGGGDKHHVRGFGKVVDGS